MADSFIGLPLVLAAILLVLFKKLFSQPSPAYPPSPPADPLIGHVRSLPSKHQHEWFHSLRGEYGDLIYLNVLGNPLIVINSHSTAVDLLEKRGLNYSDRPRFVMYLEVLQITIVASLSYTKRCIKQRALLSGRFTRMATKDYEPIQFRESQVLLGNLLAKPDQFEKHIRRFASAIVLEVAYGHRVSSDDDIYLLKAEGYSTALRNAGPPGGAPPDIFPILKYVPSWVPGAWWSRYGDVERPNIRGVIDFPFEDVVKQMSEGTASPSFVQGLMEQLGNNGTVNAEDAEDVKEAAAIIFAAGSDTTWATLNTFIFAMLWHPDAKRRAQQELDSVVGLNTLPTFRDRESLPFIECLVQEVFRLYPVGPLGIPHFTREADMYKDMFIPKGATVLSNIYSIHRDPAVYDDPDTFNPERYLPKPEGNGEPYPTASWGYGRRICPGKWMADASVWLVVAHMLAVFDIKPAKRDDGREILPDVEFESGIVNAPKPFVCHIVPRSDKAVRVIEQGVAGI